MDCRERAEANTNVDDGRTDAVIERVNGIEKLRSIRELAGLLAASAG